MRFFKLIIDLFFLSRPVIWVSVWGFSAFGYYRGASALNNVPIYFAWSANDLYSFFWIFIFSASVGSVFVLNQIADLEVDKNNDGVPLLVKTDISKRLSYITAGVFAGISIILPVFFKPLLSVFSLSAVVIGFFYSFKPTYFSGRMIFDFLSNALGYGFVAFGVGYYLAGGDLYSKVFLLNTLPYILLMSSASISSTLPDIIGDKKCGKNTTAVVLGEKNAHILATVLLILGVVSAYWVSDKVVFISSVIILPIYFIHLFKPSQKAREACYKIGGLFLMIASSIVYPAMLFPSVLIVFFTVMYFKIRYGVQYPSLVPIDNNSNL